MGDVLRLPEDELALIRQASKVLGGHSSAEAIEDINRLLPQLQCLGENKLVFKGL